VKSWAGDEEAEEQLGNAVWELVAHGVDGSVKRESVVATIAEILVRTTCYVCLKLILVINFLSTLPERWKF